MKQWMVIEVRGHQKSWSFNTKVDARYLQEWQADGLQIFVLSHSIPKWAVDLGLLRPWCWVQDAWKVLRLW